MSKGSESSVLFNLKELMQVEEARIRDEENARREALEQAKRRRDEEHARLRLEEEDRIAAARQAAEDAERAARLEEERVLRERREHELRVALEVEAAARAAEAARREAHERALAEIEAKKPRAIPRWAVASAIAVVLAAGVGVYFGVVVPAAEQSAALAAELERRAAAAATAQQRLEEAQRDRDLTEAQVAELRAASERAQRELAAIRAGDATPTATPPRPSGTRTGGGTVRPPTSPTQQRCSAGPLGCLRPTAR